MSVRPQTLPVLGDLGHLEPGAWAPGAILAERFCAIGARRDYADGWALPVTDLQRRLGTPPNHQLELLLLPADEARARALRQSLGRPGAIPQAHGLLSTPDGVALVVDPPPQAMLVAPPAASGVVGDLGALITAMEPTLSSALPPRVTLQISVQDGPHPVAGSREELRLLVVNLLLSGRDSLPDGGLLSVRVRRAPAGPDTAARASAAGGHALVEISTRGHQRAALLGGLHTCRKIVARLGGFLDMGTGPAGDLLLCAFLPLAAPSPHRDSAFWRATIFHPDPRVCSTLVGALGRMGVHAAPGDATAIAVPWAPGLVLFAPPAVARGLVHVGGTIPVILLVRRGQESAPQPALRVPFALGELEFVLGALDPGTRTRS